MLAVEVRGEIVVQGAPVSVFKTCRGSSSLRSRYSESAKFSRARLFFPKLEPVLSRFTYPRGDGSETLAGDGSEGKLLRVPPMRMEAFGEFVYRGERPLLQIGTKGWARLSDMYKRSRPPGLD